MKKIGMLVVGLLVAQFAQAAVEGREIRYVVGDQVHVGYLARDTALTEPRPGVLVVHEWWGQNRYARTRAEMLAKAGYVAFALDMYGGGKSTTHPKEAAAFMQAARDTAGAIAGRFATAQRLLASHPAVDGERIAAIGYCFGGAVVLDMARQGANLRAVASFHGSLATDSPAQPGQVQAHVLVFNGEDDPLVPAESVAAFKTEMKAADVRYRYVGYPGVKHSFTNPGATAVGRKYELPLAYDEAADADSWEQLLILLDRTL